MRASVACVLPLVHSTHCMDTPERRLKMVSNKETSDTVAPEEAQRAIETLLGKRAETSTNLYDEDTKDFVRRFVSGVSDARLASLVAQIVQEGTPEDLRFLIVKAKHGLISDSLKNQKDEWEATTLGIKRFFSALMDYETKHRDVLLKKMTDRDLPSRASYM